jgi:hypothetical protein
MPGPETWLPIANINTHAKQVNNASIGIKNLSLVQSTDAQV